MSDGSMIEVIQPGLETTIQDYPGRVGYWNVGIPPSGPADALAFQLANLLVGNDGGWPALEIQYIGPTIRFRRDSVVALTGADVRPKVDAQPIPMWRTIRVRAGQVLECSFARNGARAYLAIDGGIDVPPVLGSRSTFVRAGIGGVDGQPLTKGMRLPLGASKFDGVMRRVREDVVPAYGDEWTVAVIAGPHDDWLDEQGRESFLASPWTVQAQSDRTGYRLAGRAVTFDRRALEKPPENGPDPTNIINYGYPLGAINYCGSTPIILLVDGPSQGGFITPYVVASAELWKVAQARPGDRIRFQEVSLSVAGTLSARLLDICSPLSLEEVTD
jgi:biotin-dependent carboxylase-like uncharacterized protein